MQIAGSRAPHIHGEMEGEGREKPLEGEACRQKGAMLVQAAGRARAKPS